MRTRLGIRTRVRMGKSKNKDDDIKKIDLKS